MAFRSALTPLVLAAVTSCGVGLAGCRSARLPAVVGAVDTPVVATVGGTPIHGGEVAAQSRRAQVAPRQALDQLVFFELLARAAVDAGMGGEEADDDESEAVRSATVQRLVEREIEPQITLAAIPDSDVRALYERGMSRFVHGRLVQVGVLCIFTGARMKPEPRARMAEDARRLQEAVAKRPTEDVADWEALARDPDWSARKVSFTTVWQGDDAPFPAVLGAAVKKLHRRGETTDLVFDETGYYIARYVAERPPENVSFAQAAPRLRAEMLDPWRRQRFLQLTLAMAQGHDIEIFPENFGRMVEAGE